MSYLALSSFILTLTSSSVKVTSSKYRLSATTRVCTHMSRPDERYRTRSPYAPTAGPPQAQRRLIRRATPPARRHSRRPCRTRLRAVPCGPCRDRELRHPCREELPELDLRGVLARRGGDGRERRLGGARHGREGAGTRPSTPRRWRWRRGSTCTTKQCTRCCRRVLV